MENPRREFHIYLQTRTRYYGPDGGTGPGSWGAMILVSGGGYVKQAGGYFPETNKSHIWLVSAIEVLKLWGSLGHPEYPVVIFADSEYLVFGITNWIYRWKNPNYQGWINSSTGKPIRHKEEWLALDKLREQYDVKWRLLDKVASSSPKGQRFAWDLANKHSDMLYRLPPPPPGEEWFLNKLFERLERERNSTPQSLSPSPQA